MNVADSIWNKLTRVVVFLLLLAILAGIGVWYLPLIQQNERMRKEIDTLDAQLQKESETKRQLEEEIRILKTNPQAVERLIRSQLLYAKTNETVIRFVAPLTNSTTAR